MNTPYHRHLKTAFLQVAYAIKAWHYLDTHRVPKQDFDDAITLDDEGSILALPDCQFQRYGDILLAAQNAIQISFGAAAITLWEAVREFGNIKPQKLRPND